MKNKCWLLAFVLQLITLVSLGQQYRIGTYNVRYDNKGDSNNRWTNRYPVIAELVKFHDFDIFGTQEGLQHQLDNLSSALPEYNYYGLGRDDGKEAGEHSAIFY